MNYLINRLKEPSTWRGIILVIAGVFGYHLFPHRKRLRFLPHHRYMNDLQNLPFQVNRTGVKMYSKMFLLCRSR